MYLRWFIDQTHQNKYKKSIDELVKRNMELKMLATKLRNETQESDNKIST